MTNDQIPIPKSQIPTSNEFYPGLALLAMATLLLEITLTRLFSLAQFYHFAFMAVSLALLGFGASGTALSLFPGWVHPPLHRRLALLALGFALTTLAGYLITNNLPFDSYSIAWDRRQLLYLAIYFLALAVPFGFGGLAVGLLLAARPADAGRLYAANLAGSALGCLGAMLVLPLVGAAGSVAVSAGLAVLAALAFLLSMRRIDLRQPLLILGSLLTLLITGWLAIRLPAGFQVHLSPYKSLSQALRVPGAHIIFQGWNSFSRVDIIASPSIRMLPGLSFTYSETPPAQHGLTVDGDSLSPVLLISATDADAWRFVDFLPEAAAYRLRPGADVLVLEPKGGLSTLAALHLGASRVTVVESNPLIVRGVRATLPPQTADPYAPGPSLTIVQEDSRSFLQRTRARFDLIQWALTDPFRPVASGAYSLAENYSLTIEAFQDGLRHLDHDGILVVTRWLQMPPSESLRTLAMIIEALIRSGVDAPVEHIIVYRGIQTVTFLVGRRPFTSAEVDAVRAFALERRFDLVTLPDLRPDEINRYNVLPEPYYASAFRELLTTADRYAFYDRWPFAVAPPTDDHPFFFHFFRWAQTPAILAQLGKTWQPFGGSGYLVLLALLALVVIASLVLILLPLAFHRSPLPAFRPPRQTLARWRVFAYFTLLGLGFLCVEIPLIQRFILFLGQPAYALMAVLFALLLFAGIGSALAARWPLRVELLTLTALVLAYPWLLSWLFGLTLGVPLAGRFAVAVLALLPLGLLLGMPFPQGIRLLERNAPHLIPWAWAMNGCVSVISSVLAAILALSFGFTIVLMVGAAAYAAAMMAVWRALPARGGGDFAT
ncbi:MAG TPA: hypothetical protein EYP04_06855 [Anaerolineae bacterium]|nr:hypothetical protein [Anaerolineae bacterium]HIQ05404.1 hypothetical protein [Anaerolineae bacterium]